MKEKAKEAWESDTRKEAWQMAKDAWESDTRKEAWKKTKEKASELSEKTSQLMDKASYQVPITERRFINIVPDDYMLNMSEKQYRNFLSSSTISSDAARTAQVKRVTGRLQKAVEQFYTDQGMGDALKEFNWEFNLVKSNTVNAFCMPGGKIVVYEGIMDVASSDAELAVVVGHEIAHAIAKHSAEQMTKGIITTVGVATIYAIISKSDISERKKALAKILLAAGTTLTTLKFSRQNETEADRLGLIIAAMAGYKPDVAVNLWKKMGDATGNKGKRDWYSTHPSNVNRIDNIKSFLPEANEYYKGN